MEPGNDPNAPDCTNGDFFCRLCLASMNSEGMWSSHIAGKRHIKNVQKYPNGLPKRRLTDDEDSYDRPAKHERYDNGYEWGDGYPPPDYPQPDGYPPPEDDYYYEDDYYNSQPPMDYEPVIKPNVVFDYGHTKKLEDKIPPPEPRKSEVIPPHVNVDDILSDIVKSDAKKRELESQKDDFFEKLNQREIAKDIANELAKKCFYKGESKSKVADKDPKPKISCGVYEGYDKRKSSDIFDIFHKHNDKTLFKASDKEDSKTKSSSSKKPSGKSQLKLSDDFDPDKLTPDMLDDLLSAHLKPKVKDSDSSKTTISQKHSVKDKVSLDDPKIIAEKLETFPTMTFLELIHKKLKNLDLKSSEELKMLLKIVSEAQAVVCKNLPPNLQALVKAKMSGNYIENAQAPVHSTAISQNHSIVPTTSSIQNTVVSQNCTVAPISSQLQKTVTALFPRVASIPSPIQTVVSQSHTLTSNPSHIPAVQNQTAVPVPLPVQNTSVSRNKVFTSVSSPVLNTAVSRNQIVSHVPSAVQSTTVSKNCTVPSRIQNTVVSQNNSVLPIPPPVLNSAGMSVPTGSVPSSTAVMYPMPTVLNSASNYSLVNQTAWQNYQTNAMYNYYHMMYSMYQNRHATPTNVNSIPSTSQQPKNNQSQQPKQAPKQQQPSAVSKPQPQVSKEMLETLKKLQALAEDYKKSASAKKAKS